MATKIQNSNQEQSVEHKIKVLWIALSFLIMLMLACTSDRPNVMAEPLLKVSPIHRYLVYQNGDPFFWLGGTPWAMPEALDRDEVDHYLDNRKAKGFNLIQTCLFWGKRQDDPITFTLNPPNAFGHKVFEEASGIPVTSRPSIKSGGSPTNPNDFYDHVDYILQAAEERDMIVALLPVWGRRYVNASSKNTTGLIFCEEDMWSYGRFLGERFKSYANIIWVLGGDVKADDGGDFLMHYRKMAEGIIEGITGETVLWYEQSKLWNKALMTYHPDGAPMKNSSLWFHNDAWLDFNMIETYDHRDKVVSAIRYDYALSPIKPTVMAEPAYEGDRRPGGYSTPVEMRRQAYQSLFAGAAGFTYGAFRDSLGNGPLFSVFKGWEKLLDREGAISMEYFKSFCLEHQWPDWVDVSHLLVDETDTGMLQKMVVKVEFENKFLVYFPTQGIANINLPAHFMEADLHIQWFNPKTNQYLDREDLSVSNGTITLQTPDGFSDALLIISE